MLLFIGLVLSVIISVKVIVSSLNKSANYYEYVKNEMNARCTYEDYAFAIRK